MTRVALSLYAAMVLIACGPPSEKNTADSRRAEVDRRVQERIAKRAEAEATTPVEVDMFDLYNTPPEKILAKIRRTAGPTQFEKTLREDGNRYWVVKTATGARVQYGDDNRTMNYFYAAPLASPEVALRKIGYKYPTVPEPIKKSTVALAYVDQIPKLHRLVLGLENGKIVSATLYD